MFHPEFKRAVAIFTQAISTQPTRPFGSFKPIQNVAHWRSISLVPWVSRVGFGGQNQNVRAFRGNLGTVLRGSGFCWFLIVVGHITG